MSYTGTFTVNYIHHDETKNGTEVTTFDGEGSMAIDDHLALAIGRQIRTWDDGKWEIQTTHISREYGSETITTGTFEAGADYTSLKRITFEAILSED